MTLDVITSMLSEQLKNSPTLGKTMKISLKDEGVVFLDFTTEPPSVSNEDKDADCTIISSLETIKGIRDGSVNPTMAFAMGKVKVKGDMGLAMKLQSILAM